MGLCVYRPCRERSAFRDARREWRWESRSLGRMTHLWKTLSRLLRKGGTHSPRCPACQTSLLPRRSFCPHCYMVLRPEGMADLQQALQGAKVRTDIYILRKLHLGDEEGCSATRIPATPSADVARSPTDKREPRSRNLKTQGLMTYASSTPPSAGLEDLPALIRWFLKNDRLVPNNLDILEEAHRLLHGPEDGWTYERRLASAIADDLRTYDSPDLLQGHLTLLTTVYARTLQALRTLGSRYPALRSPADLPEPERHKTWELCLRLGLTATRLRVEGWIYQSLYGEVLDARMATATRRSGVRVAHASRKPRRGL